MVQKNIRTPETVFFITTGSCKASVKLIVLLKVEQMFIIAKEVIKTRGGRCGRLTARGRLPFPAGSCFPEPCRIFGTK